MCPSIVNLLGICTMYPYLVSPEFGIRQQLEQVVTCSLALCAPGAVYVAIFVGCM